MTHHARLQRAEYSSLYHQKLGDPFSPDRRIHRNWWALASCQYCFHWSRVMISKMHKTYEDPQDRYDLSVSRVNLFFLLNRFVTLIIEAWLQRYSNLQIYKYRSTMHNSRSNSWYCRGNYIISYRKQPRPHVNSRLRPSFNIWGHNLCYVHILGIVFLSTCWVGSLLGVAMEYMEYFTTYCQQPFPYHTISSSRAPGMGMATI